MYLRQSKCKGPEAAVSLCIKGKRSGGLSLKWVGKWERTFGVMVWTVSLS